MKNISLWNDNEFINYPSLEENKDVDVLIIGCGITGISAYYHLKDTGLNITLVEQNKIAMSTTGNSTGKLSFLQNDLIDKIRENASDKKASLYLKSQIDIINDIKNVIKENKIDCDIKKVDSYLYTNKYDEIDKIKKLELFLNKNNIKVYHDDVNLALKKYIINVKDTYIFNPVKFVYGLIKENSNIYENTSLRKIEYKDGYYICYTDNGYVIKSKYVVLASHYPYFTIPYMFPLKASLEKSYISASKIKIKPISLISYSNPFISIRTYKDYLVYLSNSHSINKDCCDKENYNELLKKINDLNLKPDYLWCNIDVMTKDGLPIIGKLKNNLLIATGYNTWGLSTGFLAGKILSDIILKKKNKYMKLFNPKRSGLYDAKTIKNSMEGYISGMLNGTNYKCPHLGCKLVYNEVNETYDCPCHGSRFDKEGKCISSPSNNNIEIKKD